MNSQPSHSRVNIFLCIFYALVLGFAFAFHPHFPLLIIAGESSVGTWISGSLLVISGTLCLMTSTRVRWYPWLPIAAFFFILALDERFMFHEQLKEIIIFRMNGNGSPGRILYELPVIAGAFVGFLVSFKLWSHFDASRRKLLIAATSLGTLSVIVDIFSLGVLWEEIFKLAAELSITCSLTKQIE